MAKLTLDVTTETSQNPGMAAGTFDVAVLAGNWDSRSTALIGSDIRIDTAIVCTLVQPVLPPSFRANVEAVRSFAASTARSVIELEVDRKSQYAIVRAMSQSFHQVARRAGRPIRVLIDLAGTSRFTALAIMAWGFRSGIVAEFEFSYALATAYQMPEKTQNEQFLFRSGDWLPTPIPGLGSPGSTGATNRLVVSAGFEGKRTRRLIDLLEPDELVLFLATSPIAENNQILDSQLAPLRSAVQSSRLSEVRIPMKEVGAAAIALGSLGGPANDRDRAVSILLAGPKIASLAAAIAAIDDKRIQNVFYIQAERHEPVDVLAIAEYLLVRVKVPWSKSVLGRE